MSEAMLRLLDNESAEERSVEDLQAMIPAVMRSILVDRARLRGALKREAFGRAVSTDLLLQEVAARSAEVGAGDLEDLDEALLELAAARPKSAAMIEARIFSGLSAEDAAKAIGVGNVYAKVHWVEGLRFLRRRFGVGEGGDDVGEVPGSMGEGE